MAEMRSCEECGASFEPVREHARFCSPRCRVAWNRATRGSQTEDCALGWSVTAMQDTTQRLGKIRVTSTDQALAVISEAVWWVTIVDATLVRYHPRAYQQAMAALRPAERRRTESTLAGLRFVRNRMGYHTAASDFVRSGETARNRPQASVADLTWRSLPEPDLTSLTPQRVEWEISRYRAYQACLAGHSIGEAFQRTSVFLAPATDS
jgi:hypothetical protein